MADPISRVEGMFKAIDANLDCIATKLDSEFLDQQMQTSGKEPAFHVAQKPIQMLQRISEIKSEFSSIVQELEAIQQAEKEAIDFFRDNLALACESLLKLQVTCKKVPAEKPEELKRFEALLEVPPTGEEKLPCSADERDSSQPADTEYECASNGSAGEENEEAVNTGYDRLSVQDASDESSSVRRTKSNELVELDEQELNSVSVLIRGRVTLEEVNRVYRILWNHFKEEGHSQPLSSADMFKMGLRVAGKTGIAKLKILQSLKLVSVSSKGDVKLL